MPAPTKEHIAALSKLVAKYEKIVGELTAIGEDLRGSALVDRDTVAMNERTLASAHGLLAMAETSLKNARALQQATASKPAKVR